MQDESISIVVCVRNGIDLLKHSLPVMVQEMPAVELMVIDGNSTDGTQDFARTFTKTVISDEGKGLAYARQLGINHSTRPYVAFVGPDNIITKELMYAMQHALEVDPKLAAVAPQTEVIDAKTYWENATKYIFKYIINRPGPAETIGTPCMYKHEIVSKIQYDPAIRAAGDDTDLSLRLRQAGYALAIIDAYTQEKNSLNYTQFSERWRWYGKGDAEFYAKHRDSWTLRRRLQSITHPLRKYGVRAPFLFLHRDAVRYIPALYVAMGSRYQGWWRRSRELRHHHA